MPSVILNVTTEELFSDSLGRNVVLTHIVPSCQKPFQKLLLLNDGQYFGPLRLVDILNNFWEGKEKAPFLVTGIHAGHDRLHEYGIAGQADYAGRGSRASHTTSFVINELLPYLSDKFQTSFAEIIYAGFSLGGLMALDITWQHPGVFSRVGVFSGALWWRQKALDDGYRDEDRIMHRQIWESARCPDLKFWFQCGGKDETDDRDGDGVIDSIQDTLECIVELERKGFFWGKDIRYVEVPDGEHNVCTWSGIMPDFLEWAFGD
ncbi:alpha/beta hydrolase [Dyadobacter helix]|uniref:alpha/beta hydrolase n=1 Tax=Dyadobacter helix TaxID=2822344 RepID=UPI001E4F3B8B|nr:alpha/beta hydrolase-fold protein [Dyadobacter sp. CECT 9275]